MKCSSNCRYLCSVNSKGRCYCKRTGWDIKDLPPNILEDCSKFSNDNRILYDFLKGKIDKVKLK